MTLKYIDVSQTFNGDGTTSSGAASSGAAGAWNTLAGTLGGSPTYGSVNNGDRIYIRTADAGGDLSETRTANITLPVATSSAPITWCFDDGTVWAHSGTFTSNATALLRNIVFSDYNHVIGVNKNFIFKWNTTGNLLNFLDFNNCMIISGIFEFTGGSGTETCMTRILSSKSPFFQNVKYIVDRSFGSTAYPLIQVSQFNGAKIDGIEIDVSSVPDTKNMYLFSFAYYSNPIVKNLLVTGDNEKTFLYIQSTSPNNVIFDNIKSDGLMQVEESTKSISANHVHSRITENDGNFGYTERLGPAINTWKGGANYPVLNALLPDGVTKWSTRVDPRETDAGLIGIAAKMLKYFDQTAGTKTIKTELLINDNLTSPLKSEWWAVINYTDSTGVPRTETTYDMHEGALATSTAAWNTTAYGGDSYDKYKVELTTANQIKTGTDVEVVIYSNRPSIASTDFYFIDPDFTIT